MKMQLLMRTGLRLSLTTAHYKAAQFTAKKLLGISLIDRPNDCLTFHN